MYFTVETERNGLPRTSNIIHMALIGAELLLAQQFEPLVFISRVLNPRLIGFAIVSVIYAASNYSFCTAPPGHPLLSTRSQKI